jgi:hypothetical protein
MAGRPKVLPGCSLRGSPEKEITFARHLETRVGIDRHPERGVSARRWNQNPTRNVIVPPYPRHRPHGRRKKGESSFRKTQLGKRALVRHPQCFEAVIENDTRRQKGGRPGSGGEAG